MRYRVFTVALLAWGAVGCQTRAAGTVRDAAVLGDVEVQRDVGGPPADAALPPGPCDPLAGALDFGLQTAWPSTLWQGTIQQWDIGGSLGSLGPPADPGSGWDGEAQFLHADGTLSILSYKLPPGATLPLQVGMGYQLLFRESTETGVHAVGLIISRPTSGLHPLMIAADVGGMLEPEDPRMSPFKAFRVASDRCPTELAVDDCHDRVYDAIRFDTSTGGAVVELRLETGEQGRIPVFGDDFLVFNRGAGHVENETGFCGDYLLQWVYYLAFRVGN